MRHAVAVACAVIAIASILTTGVAAFGHAQGVPPHFAQVMKNIEDMRSRAKGGWFGGRSSDDGAPSFGANAAPNVRSRDPNLPSHVDQETVIEAHSFTAPLFDSAFSRVIPHWDFGLSTVVTDNYVRLTPEDQSREGYLWNTVPLRLPSWTAHLGFRVHGASSTGADGFGLWLSSRRSTTGGPMFGVPDNEPWEGFGIIFDSFDNDGARDNPSVTIIRGADTPGGFPPQHRSGEDFRTTKAASCVFDFRVGALDKQLVGLQMSYDDGELRIDLRKGSHEIHCATLSGLNLPSGRLYFGMTGHTGGLADSHDMHYFVVTTHEKDISEERLAELTRDRDMAQGFADAQMAGGQPGGVPPAASDVVTKAAAATIPPPKPKDFSHHEDKAEREKWKPNQS